MAEHRDFTLEDILAEQRRKREGQQAPAPAQPVEELPAAEPQAGAVPEYQEQAGLEQASPEQASLEPEAPAQEAAEDLNAYAAGAAYDIANIRSVPVPQWNPEELKDSLNRIGGYNGSQGRPTVSPEQYAKMSADRLKTIADRANEIANNLKLSEESGPKFP